MTEKSAVPGWRDDVLLTPGPLTTSRTVKQAMLRDLGSRDETFIETVRDIRRRLLDLAGVAPGEYEAIPLQGSGTFGVEAVFASTVPPDGKVLIIENGAYGKRMAAICAKLRIPYRSLVCSENQLPDLDALRSALGDDHYSHVAAIHCETTTGIINPIEAMGAIAHEHGAVFYVDAMSSFGAVPIDFQASRIDYLVSSSNKCIEGVPGFSFVIAKRSTLEGTEGWARSLSLDLLAQWQGLEANGQFRFTPPTHAMLAFHQALTELEAEGGVAGRAARYRRNYETLLAGMRALGFEPYLPPELQGYIITSFRYPASPDFDFETFYQALKARGFVIYPGKVSDADCFRIGNIGRIFESDIQGLLGAMRAVAQELHIELAARP